MFSPQKWGKKAGNAVLNNSGILFPGFCRIPAALGGVELLLDGYGMFEEAVDALEVHTAVSHVLDGAGKAGKQSWNSRIFLTSPLIPGNLKFEVFPAVGSWEKPLEGLKFLLRVPKSQPLPTLDAAVFSSLEFQEFPLQYLQAYSTV